MEKFSSFGFFKLRSESREKPKVLNVRSAFSMCGNGLRLCEEADFGAQNCQDSTNVDAR